MGLFGLTMYRLVARFFSVLLLAIGASSCFAWSNKVTGVADVYFSGETTQLTPGHQQAVDGAIARIKNANIYFVGITFKRPRDGRWLEVGKARAIAVAKHFSELGVSPKATLNKFRCGAGFACALEAQTGRYK
jgi:hypothetical protein